MSIRYSLEELLKLRASPLISKPPNLPPVEEWMGPQESAAKRPNTRGKQEDSVQGDGFQRRPALESTLRKSTTDPERIVLGPPRRSFASSTGRPYGKPGIHDSEELQSERPGYHDRLRAGDDVESRFGDRRAGHHHTTNGRHSARHDQDGGERSRRRHEDDDAEDKSRRDFERPKWAARDGRDEKGIEDTNDESGKLGLRRDQGRSRFEQPWFRADRGGDDSRRDGERATGWRQNRVKDGDWDTPGKVDMDPEWMDSIDNAEPVQAHTQEDFQRWKERMKASSGPAQEKSEPPNTNIPETFKSQDAPPVAAAPFASIVSPEISSNSMDKFFARFNDKTTTTEQNAGKPVTKTRFASIFGPVPEARTEPAPPLQLPSLQSIAVSDAVPPPPPPTQQSIVGLPSPPASKSPFNADADQAGFQRILEMLGKREASTTPNAEASKAKLPQLPTAHSAHQRNNSPDLVALFKQEQPARQASTPQAPVLPGFERLLDSRSPGEPQRHVNTPNKDELLLNLLRQAEITAKPSHQSQPQYHENRVPANLFGAADVQRGGARAPHAETERPQMQQRDPGRSMFDDPAISSMSYQEEMRARERTQRRAGNAPNDGFDENYLESLRANGSQQKMHPSQNLPPGLQRPPGFEQMPRLPPGYDRQAPPPPQQTRQGPPPGLGRGMLPQYGGPPPPQMPPMSQQMPGQGAQRPPQRKYTGESSMPGFPPGMGPPPGFMAGGAPPGFHHGSAAGAAQNYGRFAMGGSESLPQPPQNMGRAFMEMYGNGDRGGMRGGNGGVPLPPGFR